VPGYSRWFTADSSGSEDEGSLEISHLKDKDWSDIQPVKAFSNFGVEQRGNLLG
jgi:hypothetical protein